MKECFPPTTKAVPAGTITITRIVCCSSVAKATTDERILEVVVAIVVVGVAVGAAVAVAVAAAGLQLLQQQRQQQLRGALRPCQRCRISFGGASAASRTDAGVMATADAERTVAHSRAASRKSSGGGRRGVVSILVHAMHEHWMGAVEAAGEDKVAEGAAAGAEGGREARQCRS